MSRSRVPCRGIFTALGLIPTGSRPTRADIFSSIHVDYKLGLTGPATATPRAAREQARALGHHYIRPEHIVLGLLALPEELAARALDELGITRPPSERRSPRSWGARRRAPPAHSGVAPQTKRLLELARAIAKSLGHNCPRTEHVLVAAGRPSCTAQPRRFLTQSGTTPERSAIT